MPISASCVCSTCASAAAVGGSPVAAMTVAVKPSGDARVGHQLLRLLDVLRVAEEAVRIAGEERHRQRTGYLAFAERCRVENRPGGRRRTKSPGARCKFVHRLARRVELQHVVGEHRRAVELEVRLPSAPASRPAGRSCSAKSIWPVRIAARIAVSSGRTRIVDAVDAGRPAGPVLVGAQHFLGIRIPFVQLERTGADGGRADRCRRRSRSPARSTNWSSVIAVRIGASGWRQLEDDGGRRRASRCEAIERIVGAVGGAGLLVEDALERRLHVGRRHRARRSGISPSGRA